MSDGDKTLAIICAIGVAIPIIAILLFWWFG